MLTVITPCKGRLEHVRTTAPINAAGVAYVLVDYDCPDRAGDWVEAHLPTARVVRIVSAPTFNKSRAHNQGAKAAIGWGASWLCFADADTIFEPEFVPWMRANCQPGRFLIAGHEHRDLTGLLVVHAGDFALVNGFDESFSGWGSEDLDMRIRLRLQLDLDYRHVPPGLLVPIEHGDRLRTQFYREPNRQASNQRNMARVVQRIVTLTGDPFAPQRLDVRQLLGDPAVTVEAYRQH